MRRLSQIVIALLIALASVLVCLELMEKYLAPLLSSNVVDNTAQPMYLEDAQLGVRPNPHYADHDGRGWRNPSALGDVSIVALGDSQTYGLGVKQSQSWPSQLSEILHQPVYQIAFG